MKTCPNCGSKMDQDVNFCTNCGTDLRIVPLDSEVEKAQSVSTQDAPQQNDQQTVSTDGNVAHNHSSSTDDTVINPNTQNTQNTQKSADSSSNSNQQPLGAQMRQHITQNVQNFDAHNMWQWFVNSWKHPFADQQGERWYGWVALLVEDILIGLGMFIGEQRVAGAADSMLGGTSFMSSSANFTFGTAIEVIFFIALAEAIVILAAHLSYKVIYGKSKDFMEFTNHIVHTSNLAAIFIVVYFLFMLIMGPAGIAVSVLMLWLAVSVFELALMVVVLGDPNPVHDKFYGFLLFMVLQAVAGLIFVSIIGATLISQIGSSIPGL
ncbi:zinc ribbon domain-containing protein [Lactobacillus intestinalis]|nr:zinc ribbon domain-containing protein [Lactobacillus intestinalis]